MGDLTRNFSRHEFRCHGASCCAGTSAPQEAFVKELQAIRSQFGQPIHVIRGFSCNVHNKAVGGVFLGWHTRGGGGDMQYLPGVHGYQLVTFCRTRPKIGMLILYDNHWHMDIRPRLSGRMTLIDKRTK